MSEPRKEAEAPPLKTRLISGVGGGLLTSLMATTRFRATDAQNYLHRPGGRTAIYLLWHGRLLPGSYRHRNEGLATLISQHRDGDYIAGVVERWGYEVVRGSSSRGGGAALRQLVRLLKSGTSIALTPDGPRGPRQRMKLGPLVAAQLTGVPIVPLSAGTDHAWWFEGWDRFLVPKPFARIRIAYAEPVFVPRSASQEELEAIALQVEGTLNALTARVDAGG